MKRREFLAARLESDYNVVNVPDPAGDGADPTTSDAICCYDPSWNFSDVRRVERDPNKPSYGRLPPLEAGELVEVTVQCDLKGGGVAGARPEFHVLMLIAGHSFTEGASVEYTPDEDSESSATIDFYESDGDIIRLSGCRVSDWSIQADVGDKPMIVFTIKGHFVDEITGGTYPDVLYLSLKPPAVLGVSCTIGSFTPGFSSF
ncbi:MAG: hypothetical protein AAGK78_14155, partial [Planctomycetota bacterium]